MGLTNGRCDVCGTALDTGGHCWFCSPKQSTVVASDVPTPAPERDALIAERWFPVLQTHRLGTQAPPSPVLRIPWSVAERAYVWYCSRYGSSQSLERIAERGGFSASELDEQAPGWRDEVTEIARLKAQLRADAEEVARQRTARDRLWCDALTRVLDVDQVHAAVTEFNRLRPDKPEAPDAR